MLELATLLERVKKQNFTLNFKKLFLFFLTVLFCCSVGENGRTIKGGNGPSHKFHKNSAPLSVSEVLYQKVIWVVYYKTRNKPHSDAIKRVDLVYFRIRDTVQV